MIEQIFFIIISIILFSIMFFKMIKKNDTSYVAIIAVQAIGIILDFVALLTSFQMNMFIRVMTYVLSVILPIIIILFEGRNTIM